MNILAEDIWRRIARKTSLTWGWGSGPIFWVLLGNEKEFGELCIRFPKADYHFDIYIYNKKLLEVEIQTALDNHKFFNEIELAKEYEVNSRVRRGLYS